MPVIVLSGVPGAGTSSAARGVAKALSLKYFSPGRLFKDVGLGNLSEQHYYSDFIDICKKLGVEIPEMSEKDDSHADMIVWQSELGDNPNFHKAIDELQVRLAKKGDIVIDGKLSVRMIPEADLSVWLEASLDERAKRTSQRDDVGLQEAKSIVKKREETERGEWTRIYGFDYFDQKLEADLLIDTSGANTDDTVQEILDFLKK